MVTNALMGNVPKFPSTFLTLHTLEVSVKTFIVSITGILEDRPPPTTIMSLLGNAKTRNPESGIQYEFKESKFLKYKKVGILHYQFVSATTIVSRYIV